jgi:hypothetical protein
VEATNKDDEFYGFERLDQAIERTSNEDNLVGAILADVDVFRGDVPFADDVTLLEITCAPLNIKPQVPLEEPHKMPWSLTVKLGPEQFLQKTTVGEIVDIICHYQLLIPCKDELHCILTELYDNSLEHGILGLDSALLSTEEGRAEYEHLRSERARLLCDDWITLEITHLKDCKDKSFHIDFKDSGRGFDLAKVLQNDNTSNDPYGRGIPLLKKLCETVEYSEKGTRCKLIYSPPHLKEQLQRFSLPRSA